MGGVFSDVSRAGSVALRMRDAAVRPCLGQIETILSLSKRRDDIGREARGEKNTRYPSPDPNSTDGMASVIET
jgi:hypothetical protein